MSRPFIREPFLVKKSREGKADSTTCGSCTKCLAAVAVDMAVRCYNKEFPSNKNVFLDLQKSSA